MSKLPKETTFFEFYYKKIHNKTVKSSLSMHFDIIIELAVWKTAKRYQT